MCDFRIRVETEHQFLWMELNAEERVVISLNRVDERHSFLIKTSRGGLEETAQFGVEVEFFWINTEAVVL